MAAAIRGADSEGLRCSVLEGSSSVPTHPHPPHRQLTDWRTHARTHAYTDSGPARQARRRMHARNRCEGVANL